MSTILPAGTSDVLQTIAVVIICTISFFASVYVITWLRFQYDLYKFKNVSDKHNLRAPRLPVFVPWIGNAPSFLSMKPNKFWGELFSWYPHSLGAISMTLGGITSTIIFDRQAASYLMKDRKLGRESQNVQVVMGGFGLSKAEAEAYYEYHMPVTEGKTPGHIEAERINSEYLLKSDRVNEMTAEFFQFYRDALAKEPAEQEVGINRWLRRLMFQASTTALMGSKILDVIPNLENLFFTFDQSMLSLFFGLPELLVRKPAMDRNEAINALVEWQKVVQAETKGGVVDPEDSAHWEPYYGSRINRARQIFYRSKGLNIRAQAALDLGEIFGISSNAIPAAGWMLMHILDSKRAPNSKNDRAESTLYDYIMLELRQSQRADGTIDIPTLVNQPILLSTLHEVLRLYVDVLIARDLRHDVSLPMGHPSTSTAAITTPSSTSWLNLKARSIIMMPTYPSHINPNTWEINDFPSAQTFYPYRFLSAVPGDGEKPVFSTTPYNGTFFPFGGGRTMCPGRTFAKQEILASVAMVLLDYEIEVLGFTESNGKATSQFPGLRDTLPGPAVFVANGDVRVKMKRRKGTMDKEIAG